MILSGHRVYHLRIAMTPVLGGSLMPKPSIFLTSFHPAAMVTTRADQQTGTLMMVAVH
jgi:hypothetical protein